MDATIDPYAPKAPPGQDELPCSDGEPMDTPRHRAQMNLLIESLTMGWMDRHDYYVGGDMFVYYSELQTKGQSFRGPDVFVVLDTDRDKVRKSWVAWQEDGRLPDIVIELLSPTTESVDRGEKKRIYERLWHTGHYVLFDPETLALEGFELVRGRYVPLVPDASGRLVIASMGLTLGLGPARYLGDTGTWLRWFDAAGVQLPTEGEHERARADEVQARADEVQARADEVQARADEVQARADDVQARLEAAEARVRALEETLNRAR